LTLRGAKNQPMGASPPLWRSEGEPQAGAWRLIGNSVEEFAGWRRVVSLELGVIKMRQNLVRGYQVNGGRTALNNQQGSVGWFGKESVIPPERVVIKKRERLSRK
jgi:hypothetical protein